MLVQTNCGHELQVDLELVRLEVPREFFRCLSQGGDLGRLLWDTADSRIVFPRLSRSFIDNGRPSVLARFDAIRKEGISFEPNLQEGTARSEPHGAILVECSGFYYAGGTPQGPFKFQFMLVRNPGADNTWCIRAVHAHCA
eukprot:GHVT01065188.1.p1 GENE.GHVT01065188.1~~GHVT01065188.1.p1  ORF type:complete len:141 (+),score=6.72 GHVT01065188.1:758-1180(+)